MNEAQPDLLEGATTTRKSRAKAAAAKPASKKDKKPGTAVAVADPQKRAVAAPQASPPSNFLAVVMQAATDPACNPEKMHSLLDFQERLEAREAKREFDDAFVMLQAELPSIGRDRKIEVRAKDQRTGERTGKLLQSTPYATFEAIMTSIKPLLTKYQFGLSFSTEPVGGADGRLMVKTTLSRKGHSISTSFPLPPDVGGSKNGVQVWGSSQSYGKRYGTIAILNIVSHAPEDADTDGNEGKFARAKGDNLVETNEVETLTDEEEAELNRKAIACKVPLEKILSHYDIAKLSDLPRRLFDAAKKGCDDYAENQKRKAADFPGDRARGR